MKNPNAIGKNVNVKPRLMVSDQPINMPIMVMLATNRSRQKLTLMICITNYHHRLCRPLQVSLGQ